MYTKNRYVHFEEKGEHFIARRGKIKTNNEGKLYLEVYEVEGYDGKLKVKINDYISNTLQDIRCAYVKVICKDAEKGFVDVREYTRSTASCDDETIQYLDEKIIEKEDELEKLYNLREMIV